MHTGLQVEKGADVQWFRDARLGIFIHWGLYSLAGGEWAGKRYYGSSEWLMAQASIPLAQYRTLADRFDPKAFDASGWARSLKASGARYVVVTAKHHDGFAMFESAADPFNIVDATPFSRDPLRELADAVRSEGLRFGFYYSQTQDWAEKDAVGNDWDFPSNGRDFSAYLERKALPQLRELLTRYGPVDVIWFDTPLDSTPEESKRLYDFVKSIQPKCLVSSRVGNGFGDFATMGDSEMPAYRPDGMPWEAIFTHNDNWGFSHLDSNFKSTTELVQLLTLAASRGGNFMVNVGPDGEGRLPEASTERLLRLGDWLQQNGESIYGTSGVDLPPLAWGSATRRGSRLYLHVLNPPRDGHIVLPGFKGQPEAVFLLADQTTLAWEARAHDLVVSIPSEAAEGMVIVVDGAPPLEASDLSAVISRQYPSFDISVENVELRGQARPRTFDYQTYFGVWKHFSSVDDLKSPEDAVIWSIRVDDPGEYRIALEYSADAESAGREGMLTMAGQTLVFSTLETGPISNDKPVTSVLHSIGTVKILEAARHPLLLCPRNGGSQLLYPRNVRVTPVD